MVKPENSIGILRNLVLWNYINYLKTILTTPLLSHEFKA